MARDLSPSLRHQIDTDTYADPDVVLQRLIAQADLAPADRAAIVQSGAALVRGIRDTSDPGLMEVFLAEYGLSTDEGVALMCLAEALLRVPDADTIDALIEDKIAPSNWGKHLGHSTSSLVNASTWALMLTGRVLDDEQPGMEEKGFTYSYDMLGEAARTERDAKRYHLSYSRAISVIATACTHDDIRRNPGISVKLSALHPRYEIAQEAAVMRDLVPRRCRSMSLIR